MNSLHPAQVSKIQIPSDFNYENLTVKAGTYPVKRLVMETNELIINTNVVDHKNNHYDTEYNFDINDWEDSGVVLISEKGKKVTI